jgi:heme-degrading monooxygenase HmoA
MSETTKLTRTPFNTRTGDHVMLTDAHVGDPIVVINAFSVPAGKGDLFMDRWKLGVEVMAAQPGFIQAQMFRAMDESAELSFVNVVRWASGEALAEARKNQDWQDSVRRTLAEAGARPRPMIYKTELVVNAGDHPGSPGD